MTEVRSPEGGPAGPSLVRQVMAMPVVFVDGEATLRSIASTMAEERVGSVVLLGPDGPTMVVTEQDIVTAVAAGHHVDSTWGADVASRHLITVGPEATLEEVVQLMADNDIRHLPVRAGGEIIGMVSARHVLRMVADHWTELV